MSYNTYSISFLLMIIVSSILALLFLLVEIISQFNRKRGIFYFGENRNFSTLFLQEVKSG